MATSQMQYRIPVVMQPGECCLTGRMLHDVLDAFADPEHVGRTTELVARMLRDPGNAYRKALRSNMILMVQRADEVARHEAEEAETGAHHDAA